MKLVAVAEFATLFYAQSLVLVVGPSRGIVAAACLWQALRDTD